MKETLQSWFLDQVEDLADGHAQDIKETRKEIHTRAVETAISRAPNRVLRTTPPEIQEEAVEMTRERTALTQLRSCFSSDRESFKNRIGISDFPLCPSCRLSEHTTEHIFDRP